MTDDQAPPAPSRLRSGATGAALGDDHAESRYPPHGSLQAQVDAQNHRQVANELHRQHNPKPRERVTVWETDRWGDERATGTRPAPQPQHTGRMVVAAQPAGPDDGDDTMSDLLSNRSQPSPRSSFG